MQTLSLTLSYVTSITVILCLHFDLIMAQTDFYNQGLRVDWRQLQNCCKTSGIFPIVSIFLSPKVMLYAQSVWNHFKASLLRILTKLPYFYWIYNKQILSPELVQSFNSDTIQSFPNRFQIKTICDNQNITWCLVTGLRALVLPVA